MNASSVAPPVGLGATAAPPATTPLRNAEKSRKHSTCAFADRVARLVLDTHDLIVTNVEALKDPPGQQAVVAGCCVWWPPSPPHDANVPKKNSVFRGEEQGQLECVSVARGTKFVLIDLQQAVLSPHHTRPRLLRDMHAEVMAIKGFRHWLSSNLVRFCEAGATLHLYVSSAPCGDSIVRRFAKGGLGPSFPDMPPYQWPTVGEKIQRAPFRYTQKQDGQGAFQTKTCSAGGEAPPSSSSVEEVPLLATPESSVSSSRPCSAGTPERVESSLLEAANGFSPRQLQGGAAPQKPLLSCSDRLLKYQVCGFQGRPSKLQLKNAPDSTTTIRLATLTVGRKFSCHHLNRAVWERFSFSALPKSIQPHAAPPVSCLVTTVKLDNTIYEGQNSGARFEDGKCWWGVATSSTTTPKTAGLQQFAVPECGTSTLWNGELLESSAPVVPQDGVALSDKKDNDDESSGRGTKIADRRGLVARRFRFWTIRPDENNADHSTSIGGASAGDHDDHASKMGDSDKESWLLRTSDPQLRSRDTEYEKRKTELFRFFRFDGVTD